MSQFDDIMTRVGVPVRLRIWGIPATHTPAGQAGVAATIIIKTQITLVGEFGVGERTEYQTTVGIPAASGAAVGDTFTVGSTVWTAVQLLSDDGYFRKFAVRSEP